MLPNPRIAELFMIIYNEKAQFFDNYAICHNSKVFLKSDMQIFNVIWKRFLNYFDGTDEITAETIIFCWRATK